MQRRLDVVQLILTTDISLPRQMELEPVAEGEKVLGQMSDHLKAAMCLRYDMATAANEVGHKYNRALEQHVGTKANLDHLSPDVRAEIESLRAECQTADAEYQAADNVFRSLCQAEFPEMADGVTIRENFQIAQLKEQRPRRHGLMILGVASIDIAGGTLKFKQ